MTKSNAKKKKNARELKYAARTAVTHQPVSVSVYVFVMKDGNISVMQFVVSE